MNFHSETVDNVLKNVGVNPNKGLSDARVLESHRKYGKNVITKRKPKGLLSRIFGALKEPMLIILMMSLCVALGANVGKMIKGGAFDFSECIGIFLAIVLSVGITLIMEGSSRRAFNALNKVYDKIAVRVVRNGETVFVNKSELAIGDVVLFESGDKVVADGRIISGVGVFADESALTGESAPIEKSAGAILSVETPLAERVNCLYSGTFVVNGSGKMVVTAIGDDAEIGKIAGELNETSDVASPLDKKLSKLGKTISVVGTLCAIIVFVVSLIKLSFAGELTFDSIQNLFISCIILIVAAVPEGLPTIIAVSLALNMIKLAKGNALIKKMTATETAGAVSVICTDKTGTLTKNKMSVVSVYAGEYRLPHGKLIPTALVQNFICNSTAEISVKQGKKHGRGSGTECALLEYYGKIKGVTSYVEYRKNHEILSREPFDSQKKFMITEIKTESGSRFLIKGAGEKVLPLCDITDGQRNKIYFDMEKHQKEGARVLCFAHKDNGDGNYQYDGFVVLKDEIRKEVFDAVKSCRRAGVKIKMLTGDNYLTAFSVAREIGIAKNTSEVVSASDIENLSDDSLKKTLQKITVIARSTPKTKARIVKLLKEMSEIVAVTGDGINDAPAIRHADVGIAMGKTGSEITKETADVVLLDDGFDSIVKAIAFGRNVYKNIQRFIVFQLSVNLSALLFITVCAVFGFDSPFNTLQLLWINVIMDGPPALTLGLENAKNDVLNESPVRRDQSIVNKNMMIKIAFNGIFIAGIMLAQYFGNFLGCNTDELSSATFTLFIVFQLFNAFNSRELGSRSVFDGIGKNKIMLLTFVGVFLMQVFIVQVAHSAFGVHPLRFVVWLKILAVGVSIVVISEIYKFVYRKVKKRYSVDWFFEKFKVRKTEKVNKKSIGA